MLTALISTVVILIALPVLLGLGVFCAELAVGLVARAGTRRDDSHSPARTVVLMPAHNEAKVIEDNVRLALAALPAGSSLLVIADNCTDDTAEIARHAGATVTERTDPDRRGKGYALAHGMAHLAADPPDCVIVLDADARPVGDVIDRLAATAVALQRPVQATFLIEPDPSSGPITRVSNFAHMLKNRVRQSGVSGLSGSCFLCGSGMAFPWSIISRVSLANGEIVEDLVLGVRLVLDRTYPLFLRDALVVSPPAPGDAEAVGQRRRWEHGFIIAAFRFVPVLLREAVRSRRIEPLWMALHLLVPPFVMLLAIALTLSALVAVLAWAGLAPVWLAASLLGVVCAAGLLILASWWRHGRDYLRASDILALPRYILAKAGIWSRLVGAREATWERTGR